MQNADPSTAKAVPLPFQGRQGKIAIKFYEMRKSHPAEKLDDFVLFVSNIIGALLPTTPLFTLHTPL